MRAARLAISGLVFAGASAFVVRVATLEAGASPLLAQSSPADSALGGYGPIANVTAVVAIIGFLGALLFRVIPAMVDKVLGWAEKRDKLHADTIATCVSRMEAQAQLQREHNERQTSRLHESLNDGFSEIRDELRRAKT